MDKARLRGVRWALLIGSVALVLSGSAVVSPVRWALFAAGAVVFLLWIVTFVVSWLTMRRAK